MSLEDPRRPESSATPETNEVALNKFHEATKDIVMNYQDKILMINLNTISGLQDKLLDLDGLPEQELMDLYVDLGSLHESISELRRIREEDDKSLARIEEFHLRKYIMAWGRIREWVEKYETLASGAF